MPTTAIDQSDFERILLIKPSALGDIVHALPVLNGLRVRYPQARISWLVNRDHASFVIRKTIKHNLYQLMLPDFIGFSTTPLPLNVSKTYVHIITRLWLKNDILINL